MHVPCVDRNRSPSSSPSHPPSHSLNDKTININFRPMTSKCLCLLGVCAAGKSVCSLYLPFRNRLFSLNHIIGAETLPAVNSKCIYLNLLYLLTARVLKAFGVCEKMSTNCVVHSIDGTNVARIDRRQRPIGGESCRIAKVQTPNVGRIFDRWMRRMQSFHSL